MDELIVPLLSNAPFAIVLVYWIHLDFKQRAANMVAMGDIVDKFTATLQECCKGANEVHNTLE